MNAFRALIYSICFTALILYEENPGLKSDFDTLFQQNSVENSFKTISQKTNKLYHDGLAKVFRKEIKITFDNENNSTVFSIELFAPIEIKINIISGEKSDNWPLNYKSNENWGEINLYLANQ